MNQDRSTTYTYTLELRDETGRNIWRRTLWITAGEDCDLLARSRAERRAYDIVENTKGASDYRLYPHQ